MPVRTNLQQQISTPTIFNTFTPLYVASPPLSTPNAQNKFPHAITPGNDDNLDITNQLYQTPKTVFMVMKKCRANPI